MIIHKDSKLKLHGKCRKDLLELFTEFDRNITEKEDKGNLSVLLKAGDKQFISSSQLLKDISIQTIENWANEYSSDKLIKNFYSLVLFDRMFFFRKYYATQKNEIRLIGLLTEINSDFRFIKTVLQARELPNIRNHEYIYSKQIASI